MPRLTIRNTSGSVLVDLSGGQHWGLAETRMGSTFRYDQVPYNRSDVLVCSGPTSFADDYILPGVINPGTRYYIFRLMSELVMPAGPSLRLRDPATGKLIFHSSMKPLRIVDFIYWNGASPAEVVRTYTAGRVYAVYTVAFAEGTEQTVTGQPYAWHVSQIIRGVDYRMLGHQLHIKRWQQSDFYTDDSESAPSAYSWGSAPFFHALVLDVTNY